MQRILVPGWSRMFQRPAQINPNMDDLDNVLQRTSSNGLIGSEFIRCRHPVIAQKTHLLKAI